MLQPEHLLTDRLLAPQGLVTPAPELSWTLQSDQPGDAQSAWEVEADLLAATGKATAVWRSGKRAGRLGEAVHYAGTPLPSRSVARWRVRVWDRQDAVGPWSAWASFAMGVLAPDRFAAAWIAGGGALRREFQVGSGLLRARAWVTGLGYYECYCNGQRVSVGALAPAFTEFDRRVEYEVLDLTACLQPGANVLGFLLADGWWRHGAGQPRARELQAFGELRLEYANGRCEVVATDATWQGAAGPLLPDASPHQSFDGITLDLAWLARPWCQPGAPATGWQPVHLAGQGLGELVPALLPPVQVIETLAPRTITRLAPRLLSIDFGQNFTGWVRVTARGAAGSTLVMRHAELLDTAGRLNPGTLRSAKQTNTFLLAGDPAGEVVEPRLLHHGLRYAEIEGDIDGLDLASLRGVVVHSQLPAVGHFSTPDPRLSWLGSALRWTVRSNAMSVMTDVCQRDERRGWLMDGVTGLKAGLLFYDLHALGRKWLVDMHDNQLPDGSLRGDCAPIWGPCRSVGWQRAIVLLPMALYETYGDRDLLAAALPAMRRYADFLLANRRDELLPAGFSRHPPEWLCIGKRHDELADNALAVDVLRQVAQACRLLATDPAAAAAYDEAATRMAAAAHQRWYHAASACYGGGEGFAQSSQVYALRFGLTPPAERQRVFDRLVDDLMNARGDGPFVTTGIGSTEHLPIVLSACGRDDLVWQWLQRDQYPSYGFMQQRGATAIWERWEQMTYDQMNAHNHTGLTGIGVWLRQYLLGLRTEPGAEPIFHLRPAAHLPLPAFRARWRSHWGEVALAWQRDATGGQLTVTIPPGCGGRLSLPGQPQPQVLAAGTHTLPFC